MAAQSTSRLVLRAFAVCSALSLAPSCGEQRGKLGASDAGRSGEVGNGGASGQGGSDTGRGGAAGEGTESAGKGGSAGEGASTARGGADEGGAPALTGGEAAGGEAAKGGATSSARCVYHADYGTSSSGVGGAGGNGGNGGASGASGDGGDGGAAGPVPNITRSTNRLIGDYLADARGMALYVFDADLAGDCESPPVSTCTGDCLLSWPIFYVETRLLADGLDEGAFGSILRPDGLSQTTYFGWPLHYYANDTKPTDVTGHGVGVWALAETILPNVVVRRVGADRFLADGAGHTLYAFAEDTRGTAATLAASSCLGACRAQHPPFVSSYVGAVSTLEPRDFGLFLRSDGDVQVAYKGAPLYFSLQDARPGDVNGANEAGWSIVLR